MAGTRKPRYEVLVYDKLAPMEIGDSFSKKDFILEHWKDYDYHIDRSFSVFFSMVKAKLPEKKFRTIKGIIKRLE